VTVSFKVAGLQTDERGEMAMKSSYSLVSNGLKLVCWTGIDYVDMKVTQVLW